MDFIEIFTFLFLLSYLILPIVLLKSLKYIGAKHDNDESRRIEHYALKTIRLLLIYLSIGSVIKIIALVIAFY